MHSCRRDVNVLYIVANNQNYGLTTGQASPTTPLHTITKSTPAPDGNMINPIDPVALATSAGSKFSKKILDKNIADLTKAIVE